MTLQWMLNQHDVDVQARVWLRYSIVLIAIWKSKKMREKIGSQILSKLDCFVAFVCWEFHSLWQLLSIRRFPILIVGF